MYANHMNPAVEYVSGRVRPKMRKSKIREKYNKYVKKHSRKSDADKLKKHNKKMTQQWSQNPLKINPKIDHEI